MFCVCLKFDIYLGGGRRKERKGREKEEKLGQENLKEEKVEEENRKKKEVERG